MSKITPEKEEEKQQQEAFDKMAVAIGEYIETMGGSAAVIGGVSIEEGNRKMKYTLRVQIVGAKPTKKNL